MARNTDKEALILVLDVGISMSTPINGNSTFLQSCADMVQMIIQRKMFQASKDEIGLILFGTNETANDLFKGEDNYGHIVLARPLCAVDWKLLEYVQKNVHTTNIEGDLLDALTVAADHLHKSSERTKYTEKRIMILSDYSKLADDKDMEDIIDALKSESVQLDIISPFDELPDDDGDDGDEDGKGRASNDENGHGSSDDDVKAQRKLMTNEQITNQKLLKRLAAETDGALYSFDEALSFLSLYQAKSVKSAGTKYTLEIGEEFKLPIVSMIKIKENKPELFRFKKVYAKDENVELKTDRARFTKDDEQRDLDDKTEVVDAYRYGSTYVPIDNPENLRYQVEKCFTVLGFTKSEFVKRYYYVGDSVQQILPDTSNCDEDAQQCFLSMVKGMYAENVYGIVRKVFNARSSPEVGCLIPYIDNDVACLLYMELPYEDDIRRFTLENFSAIKKFKVNDLQLELMDDLIDSMDLGKVSTGDEEAYDPATTFNPYIQRMFQTIALKGNDPNAELPDFENHITTNYLKRFDGKIRNEHTKGVLKRCADAFPTRAIETKKAKLDATELFSTKDEKKDVDEAGANESEGDKKDLNIDDLYSNVSNSMNKVSKIGTINPVNDFNTLLQNTDDATQVCDQLVDLIKQLLMEAMQQQSDSYQVKAFDCIKALRDTCLKKSLVAYFNKFLRDFKKYLFESSENRKYVERVKVFFKNYFMASKLTLITKSESDDGDLDSEAKEYLELPVESEIQVEEKTDKSKNEDVDDLLDLM